jgi:adenylate cyclase
MPDHAHQASLAALSILEGLKSLNEEWAPRIGHVTRVGIGLNSDIARVGNVGTKDMPKFGAQGSVVNVGARIESACKFFRCQALLHQSTRQQLAPDAPVRRLGKIRPVGVDRNSSFDVYELAAPGDIPFSNWKEVYEKALAAYEKGQPEPIREAAWNLAEWRKQHPEDLPALVLLRRIIDLALNPGKVPDEHPVWVLEEK